MKYRAKNVQRHILVLFCLALLFSPFGMSASGSLIESHVEEASIATVAEEHVEESVEEEMNEPLEADLDEREDMDTKLNHVIEDELDDPDESEGDHANITSSTEPQNQQAGVIYVKEGSEGDGSTWSNSFGTLQEALDAAHPGSEIWIAEGTYIPTVEHPGWEPNFPRRVHFQMKNGVEIYGGFPNVGVPQFNDRNPSEFTTVLSGDLNGDDIPGDFTINRDDNALNVVKNYNLDLDSTAVLDGVTISGGYANGNGDPGRGAGMFNRLSSPTLRNVIITDNSSAQEGGGIYNTSSSPTLINVSIIENKSNVGGGIYNATKSNPIITNGEINGNNASSGGGIFDSHSNPEYTNVEIKGNVAATGGGMVIGYNSNSIFKNVVISGNKATTGGGIHSYAGSPVSGVLYKNNPVFINVTITNNWHTMNNEGAGMHIASHSNPTIKNSIISGNYYGNESDLSEGSFARNFPSDVTFYNSIIENSIDEDGWDTDFGKSMGGNLNVNPIFVKPTASLAPTTVGDYRLNSRSPAINSGNNEHIEGVQTDLAGNPRIVNGTVDMGAYEYQDPSAAKEITEIVTTISDYTVTKGTERGELNLPSKVKVLLSDNSVKELTVTWDNGVPEYNKDTAGSYVFTGSLKLDDGILNTENYKLKVTVTIEEKQPSQITIPLNEVTEIKSGDIIQIENTKTTLTLPDDLPVGTTLEVVEVDDLADRLNVAGEIFDFKFTFPDDVENYEGTFTLTLGVDDNLNLEKTGIYYYNETTEQWEYAGGWGEAEDGTITIIVNHFSIYGVLTDLEGPTDVVVTEKGKTENSITIEFLAKDPSGIEAYVISDLSLEDVVGRIPNESGEFTYSDLEPNTEYTLSIVAIDKLGNESEPKEITIMTEGEEIASLTVESIAELGDVIADVGTERDDLELPGKVQAMLSNGDTIDLDVDWSDSMPTYDKHTADTYRFSGYIILPDGVTSPVLGTRVYVNVVTESTLAIAKVAELEDITMKVGNELHLPGEVEVSLTDGSKHTALIGWGDFSEPPYDKDQVGEYLFTGRLVLQDVVVSNLDDFMVVQRVIVEPKDTNGGSEDPDMKEVIVDGDFIEIVGDETIILKDTKTTIKLPKNMPAGKLQVKSINQIAHPGLELAGEIYNFIFDFNGVAFKGDFVLTMGVNEGIDGKSVGIYYFNEEATKWEHVSGEYEAGKITTTVEHFSIYGVFIKKDSNVEPTDPPEQEEPTDPPEKETPLDPPEQGTPKEPTDPVSPEVPQTNPSVIDDGIGTSHQTNDTTRAKEKHDQSSAKLPKTATTYFTLLSIGLLLALSGVTLYVYRRKNRIS